MTYNKTTWENRVPPRINAVNLNKMETGIEEAHDDIATLNAALVTDLISGVAPTFTDWTLDPTDAANITDGDISTFCTTGNKVCGGGYQYAYIEWDLGSLQYITTSFVGQCATTAGTGYTYIQFWDGSAWSTPDTYTAHASSVRAGIAFSAQCSKIRLGLSTSVAATLSPNIREFAAWRL